MCSGDKIGRIHHVALTVPKLQAAEDFYVGLLGLEVVYRKNWNCDLRMDAILGETGSSGAISFLSDGTVGLELFEFHHSPATARSRKPSEAGWTHICLSVDGIDAVHSALAAAGVEFTCPPSKGATGNIATYARDPFGNLIEFVQYASQ